MKKILLCPYSLFIIALSLFSILQGCENPVLLNTPGNKSLSVSAIKDSVLYKLSVPLVSISIQDSLRASFILINQANTLRRISSPDSQILQWALRGSSGNRVMQGGPSTHHVFMRTINPGDSLIFTIKQKIPDVLPGLFTLDASLYYPQPASPVLSLKVVLL